MNTARLSLRYVAGRGFDLYDDKRLVAQSLSVEDLAAFLFTASRQVTEWAQSWGSRAAPLLQLAQQAMSLAAKRKVA